MIKDPDAILLVSFGGPEYPEDVEPFLANVLRGRNVPPERVAEVAEHYYRFGGRSPLNSENTALAEFLQAGLTRAGLSIPILLGNRNWHPFLADSLARLSEMGARDVLALYTSPYGSFSSCRQYTMNVEEACDAVGNPALTVRKIRAYFNHPGFISASIDRARVACARAAAKDSARAPGSVSDPTPAWDDWSLLFSAHSIPTAMAGTGPYEAQLAEVASMVGDALDAPTWTMAYQSRSGPPSQPWLDPNLGEVIAGAGRAGKRGVVVVPIGFISEHMEVVYDIDVEAAGVAREAGIQFVRAETVGPHPDFVEAMVDLVLEAAGRAEPRWVGALGPAPAPCLNTCCAYEPTRPSA